MVIKEGYKRTHVGIIPNDWEYSTIEKKIDLLTGFPFPSNKYSKSGIQLLRGSNVKRNCTDWSIEITQFWDKTTPELRPYLLKDGDIVIAMDGSLVGRSFARLSKADLPALLLQRVARVRSDKIDMGYLKEFICSSYFTKYCDSVKTSSAIPHISPRDIREFIIPIPPTITEQTAIATALSDADALIMGLEKLIAKKRNLKQGAMQQLLQPKEGWEVKTLGECLLKNPDYGINAAAVKYNDNLPTYLRITDISENGKYLTSNKASVDHPLSSSYYLEEGDIVFARTGASVGKTYLYNKNDGMLIFAGFLIRVKANPEMLDCNYLFFLTQTNSYWDWVKANSMRSGQPGLNSNEYKSFQIPFPPKEEQTRIATILSDMDAELTALEQKLEKYKKVKLGMMQELLTGKTRLV